MESTQFYETLFQFGSDWVVTKVETDHELLQVDVYLAYRRPDAPSPGTGERCPIYDLRAERRWRHLDTMQYTTYLHARVPRVRLPSGDVVTIAIPWAAPHSHQSVLFETFAIHLLLATKNQTQSARLLRISFDQLHHIMERAVARGLVERARDFAAAVTDGMQKITHLSIDEKAYRSGHQYITVVSDPLSGRVLEISDGRTATAAIRAMQAALPPHRLQQVTAVAMDMADAYRQAVDALLPNADIVYDKFHLFKYLSNAIDQTRRAEVPTEPILKYKRFLFLKNAARRTEHERNAFDAINAINLKTAQAWWVRENFRGMYEMCQSFQDALVYFLKWKDRTIASQLAPMLKVVQTFERHRYGILCFFKHPITNAMAERLNGKIQELNFVGKGYRTVKNLRIAILFFYGKLKLFPQYSL
jgi:transposase